MKQEHNKAGIVLVEMKDGQKLFPNSAILPLSRTLPAKTIL